MHKYTVYVCHDHEQSDVTSVMVEAKSQAEAEQMVRDIKKKPLCMVTAFWHDSKED